jgi:hypothetical protein
MEAVYIKTILAILLIFCAAIAIANTAFASEDGLNTTLTGTNSTLDQHLAETNIQNNSNNPKSENSVQTSSNDDSIAAGTVSYDKLNGIWIWSTDANQLNQLNIAELKNAGITDIFVKANRITQPTYDTVLPSLIQKLEGTGINVHAWITCFKDANGNWVDPQGIYTVQVPYTAAVQQAYVAYWYKQRYKAYYKVKRRGKWVTRSRWKYRWAAHYHYRTVYQTQYKSETRYDGTFNNNLINAIADITTKYDIAGIHLDYVRYPGTAYKYSGSVSAITNFVHTVYDTVKSIKPNVAVSAALMPEGSVNAYYYGQDYNQLSQYLDFLVPMIYKGNYGKDTAWIGTTTKYIVSQANGKPVIAGLQTYKSDSNLAKLSSSELNQDIKAATDNGALGYVLFRYGLTDFVSTANSDPSSQAAGSEAAPISVTYPADVLPYLQPTANCQSNNAQIIALANSIIQSATDPLTKATLIYNWVRDKIGYSFYYNTKYGAVGTLNAWTGNCCDTSHLLIALARAAGIPARYVHTYSYFTSSGNWYGHVVAQLYVNDQWIWSDATSYRNSFGVINNWNTATYTLKGIYRELPF